MLATVVAAESVLSRRFGAKIQLIEPEDLGGSERSVVVRVRVSTSPFSLPRTMVLKRYLGPPEGHSDSFVREAASYQLFTALASEDRMCPELFAHGSDSRLVVLEDLGGAPTLADKLLGDDARAAERALLSYSRSLGRLHATTAGREADFDALQRRLTPPDLKDPLAVDGAAALDELPALLADELGLPTTPATLECAERGRQLLDNGRHRAFSPSDSCPDNNLITTRGVRFLDFEGGCVRNAIFDAAYLRVPFPSCWCPFALPAGMTDAMLAAWRAEVRVVWPDFDDDAVFASLLLDAQLFWVWLSTWQHFTRPDAARTHSSSLVHTPRASQVLLDRWQQLAEAGAAAGLDPVAEHASLTHAALRKRYDASQPLPLYPAFR
ncbi:aminoglycoside phosphotransferase family protein [Actinophytocola xinjiangensis]|uniref:aminoglycoside phosphotransferase family protein n=1 Tax=Actinophytocola xinjiangensis TaxID=485602 RepID=UPI001FE2A0CC|nr:aminoglycoside phosphotransferase family protein [Actinophytocola xinjiangensis]